MQLQIVRIIVTAIVIEVMAIVALVAIVALFGPSESDAAQAYAERMGRWVGPIAGFVLTFIGAWWVANGASNSILLHGVLVGVGVAVIDIAILVLSGSPFETIFAVSNLGRIAAGAIGGWVALQSGS